jgi:hypothetical protein
MNVPKSLSPQVVDALRRGDKIAAIKLLREASGMGLAEAKGLIDQHAVGSPNAGVSRAAAHPPRSSPAMNAARAARTARGDGLGPGEQPRSSGGAAFIAFIVVAAIGLWLYSSLG